jgi:hypothetical protein
LFLLEVDQTICKGVLKLGRSQIGPHWTHALLTVLSLLPITCSTMPAFVIVLFSHLCLCVVEEAGRTWWPSAGAACIAAIIYDCAFSLRAWRWRSWIILCIGSPGKWEDGLWWGWVDCRTSLTRRRIRRRAMVLGGRIYWCRLYEQLSIWREAWWYVADHGKIFLKLREIIEWQWGKTGSPRWWLLSSGNNFPCVRRRPKWDLRGRCALTKNRWSVWLEVPTRMAILYESADTSATMLMRISSIIGDLRAQMKSVYRNKKW